MSEIQKSGLGSEVDKAAAGVINIVAGETARGLVGFGQNLFGGMIGDRIREWRTRNLVTSAAKTADFLRERGIDLNNCSALPSGEIYQIFEGMSRAEDETLSDMYASLLANALAGAAEAGLRGAIAKALADMSPMEAKILDTLWRCGNLVEKHKRLSDEYLFKHDASIRKADLDAHLAHTQKELGNLTKYLDALEAVEKEYSFNNLVRIGIIIEDFDALKTLNDDDLRPSIYEDGISEFESDRSQIIDQFNDIITTVNEIRSGRERKFQVHTNLLRQISLNWHLTPFGQKFVSICLGD